MSNYTLFKASQSGTFSIIGKTEAPGYQGALKNLGPQLKLEETYMLLNVEDNLAWVFQAEPPAPPTPVINILHRTAGK